MSLTVLDLFPNETKALLEEENALESLFRALSDRIIMIECAQEAQKKEIHSTIESAEEKWNNKVETIQSTIHGTTESIQNLSEQIKHYKGDLENVLQMTDGNATEIIKLQLMHGAVEQQLSSLSNSMDNQKNEVEKLYKEIERVENCAKEVNKVLNKVQRIQDRIIKCEKVASNVKEGLEFLAIQFQSQFGGDDVTCSSSEEHRNEPSLTTFVQQQKPEPKEQFSYKGIDILPSETPDTEITSRGPTNMLEVFKSTNVVDFFEGNHKHSPNITITTPAHPKPVQIRNKSHKEIILPAQTKTEAGDSTKVSPTEKCHDSNRARKRWNFAIRKVKTISRLGVSFSVNYFSFLCSFPFNLKLLRRLIERASQLEFEN